MKAQNVVFGLFLALIVSISSAGLISYAASDNSQNPPAYGAEEERGMGYGCGQRWNKMHKEGPHWYREDDEIDVEMEKLSNGLRVSKTSDDPEVVAKLHEMVDRHEEMQSITREVTNTENGIEITVTTTRSDLVEKIQSREHLGPKNDEVTISKENLTNGVKITISSDNPDLVERIQEGKKGQRGGRGGMGMWGGMRGGARGNMSQ